MSNEAIVNALLSGVEFDDPRMYDLLDALISDFYALANQINPPTTRSFGATGVTVGPSNTTGFIATIYDNNVKLSWDNIAGISTYEIRYKLDVALPTDWDTATYILRTSTLSADINPLTIPLTFGSHSFLIKSIDSSGNYAATASVVTISIPVILQPVITPTVISNNVLLNWTSPTSSFRIDHYNVYKNAILQGRVSGTFEAIFEIVGGTYSYTVEAVDIVGNVGTLSNAAVVQVGSPTDFILYSTLTSTFTGTKTNCKKDVIAGSNYLLACVDVTQTWANHFSTRGWANIDAQIAAGFPIYAEPALLTGSYQEVFDFGVIISNVIVVMNWNLIPINGSVTVATSTLEYSTDNITYTAPVTGTSVFATSVRYVRFTMNFVGATTVSLAYFSNLQCLLNVHREVDSGTGTANSGDATGTVFTFNKAFRSVDSIVVTPLSTTAAFPVVNFVSALNPTTFKVLLFNDAGVRVTKDISWVARGII